MHFRSLSLLFFRARPLGGAKVLLHNGFSHGLCSGLTSSYAHTIQHMGKLMDCLKYVGVTIILKKNRP